LAIGFPNHFVNHAKVLHSSLEGQDKQGNSCPAAQITSTIFSADLMSVIFFIWFSNSPDKFNPS